MEEYLVFQTFHEDGFSYAIFNINIQKKSLNIRKTHFNNSLFVRDETLIGEILPLNLNSNIYTGNIPKEGIFSINPETIIDIENIKLYALEKKFISELKIKHNIEIKSLDDLI
jgi:hypothetical protein